MTYKPTQVEIAEIDNIFNEIFNILSSKPGLGVDLSNATLTGADLSGIDLLGAKNIDKAKVLTKKESTKKE